MVITTNSTSKHKTIDLDTCTFCDRLPTCAVFRAIEPLMKSWTPETLPFDTNKLAKVCKWFIPMPSGVFTELQR